MNIVRSSVKHAALYDVLWYMQNILWIRNSGNAHYKSMLKCYTGIILLTFLIFSPVNLKLFLYISVAHKLSLMVLPMLYLCFVNEPNSWNSFACSLVRHFSIMWFMVEVTKSNILPWKTNSKKNNREQIFRLEYSCSLKHLHGNLYGFISQEVARRESIKMH